MKNQEKALVRAFSVIVKTSPFATLEHFFYKTIDHNDVEGDERWPGRRRPGEGGHRGEPRREGGGGAAAETVPGADRPGGAVRLRDVQNVTCILHPIFKASHLYSIKMKTQGNDN